MNYAGRGRRARRRHVPAKSRVELNRLHSSNVVTAFSLRGAPSERFHADLSHCPGIWANGRTWIRGRPLLSRTVRPTGHALRPPESTEPERDPAGPTHGLAGQALSPTGRRPYQRVRAPYERGKGPYPLVRAPFEWGEACTCPGERCTCPGRGSTCPIEHCTCPVEHRTCSGKRCTYPGEVCTCPGRGSPHSGQPRTCSFGHPPEWGELRTARMRGRSAGTEDVPRS